MHSVLQMGVQATVTVALPETSDWPTDLITGSPRGPRKWRLGGKSCPCTGSS